MHERSGDTKALAEELMVEESRHCLSAGMCGEIQVECGIGGCRQKGDKAMSPSNKSA